jgi:predicted transcriptional regulator
MPHKDRDARLEYQARSHAEKRPSPAPQPQQAPELPPHGAILTSDDGTQIQCHACGRWLGSLTYHIGKTHGLSADDYKERFGLARGASLISPHAAELQRAAAIARGQGSKGVAFGPDNPAPKRTGIDNRLESRIEYSRAKKGTYRGRKPDDPPAES